MKQQKFCFPSRILFLVMGLMLSLATFAQNVIKGTVKDATGEAVIGATVQIVGQQGGAVTDFDGNFEVKVKPGTQLKISYVGAQTQTVAAANGMIVTLKDDSQLLDQVVVIGYGVAKKNDLTGSVTAIKPDEKNHGMVTSAQDMLSGKVAGVNVNSNSGAPGEGAQIRIRGGASLNASNDPLIVIDGMAMDNSAKGVSNPLALVNPNDIESFTVLKDASATAIYGSRGSNGVIIITTKKGRKNMAPKVTYSGNVSVSTVQKKLDVMNRAQYIEALNKIYSGDDLATALSGLGNADTDWQSEIYRAGVSTDHNVSVMGGVGNEKWSMPYRASVGYTDQQGTLKGSYYNRFTVGFNVNPSLLQDHLLINAGVKYAYSHNNPGNTGAIGSAISMDPTRPVTSTDSQYANWGGYWEWTKDGSDLKDPTFPYAKNDDAPSNPVEQINQYNFYRYNNTILGNFEFDYKIHGFEDLHLHANLNGEYTTGSENTNQSPYSTAGFYYGSYGTNSEKRYNLTSTLYAQYIHDFNKDHHFDIMAGYEYQHMKYWGGSHYWSYYQDTNTGTYDDGSPKAGTYNSNQYVDWAGQTFLVSWLGRLNYSYLDRYLLTVTARYDGSSRFADGHRWGFFPSAAFAWKINEEPFMKALTNISDFKLRLGWGMTGQQDTGKEYYNQCAKLSTNAYYYYPVGYGSNTGVLAKPQPYNPDLTWETTTTYNVGIDFAMFKNRLSFSVDGYIRKTTDLLCSPTIPAGMNFDNSILLNAGSLTNKGFEFSVTGKPIQTADWLLEISANIAYNKNEVTELYGGRDKIEAGLQVGQNQALTYHKVGEAANAFYVYQQVYDENGRPIMGCYVDRNGDGTIDSNDKYFYKNISAPWTGGFALKIGYKNWDLGTNFRYSLGNYVYNNIEAGKVNSAVLYNSKGYYTNSTMDIVNLGWTSYNYPLSDYFVQNASFLKCDNITLGYSFEELFKTGKYHGLSGRIYASCSNIFTITNYKGLDPEQTSGMESSVYPRSRTFLMGLSLTF